MIEEKLNKFSAEIRDVYSQLESTVFSVAPLAEEKLWAGLPSYYVGETFVRLIPFNDHINIEASALSGYKAQLSEYKFTSKDMLQIYLGQAIPTNVLIDVFKKTYKIDKGGVSADKSVLGKIVHVVVDRPLGSLHPEHADIVYGVNYGYVKEYIGGDGEPQDAYILGVDEPLTAFDGVVVAVIHRFDDNEDKWVVAPQGRTPSKDEIIEKTEFQERFFTTELILN